MRCWAAWGGAVREAAERALELVGMTEHAGRPIRGYSKGMRQRIKLAQAHGARPDGAVPRRAVDGDRSGRPARADGSRSSTGAVKAAPCWSPAMSSTRSRR